MRETKSCKACGRDMIFIEGENGDPIPLDFKTPVFEITKDLLGNEIAVRIPQAYVSHFSTCPDASRFSKKTATGQSTTNGLAWDEYAAAYKHRYGDWPVRNATVNAQISNLVKRLGTEAPAVAKFYLSHKDGRYVRAMHSVGLLLQDAEKLRTEWSTKRQMTRTEADAVDRSGNYQAQILRIDRGEA